MIDTPAPSLGGSPYYSYPQHRIVVPNLQENSNFTYDYATREGIALVSHLIQEGVAENEDQVVKTAETLDNPRSESISDVENKERPQPFYHLLEDVSIKQSG